MTNLERRALLGDKQAQEECTRKGILLSCPMCGCRAEVKSTAPYIYYVVCVWCGLKAPETGLKITALEKWNHRSAPPVGRCKDCRHLDNTGKHPVCWHTNMPLRTGEDFCSYFEMR